MNKNLKNSFRFKMIIRIVIVAIIIPIVFLTPSPYGIIPIEIGSALVAYCGSILGGLLTLYGVWITIDNSKKEKREEISIQYMPILRIEDKKTELLYMKQEFPSFDFDENGNELLDKGPTDVELLEEYYYECKLTLKNTGRGEIIDANISCYEKNNYLSVKYSKRQFDIFPQDNFEINFRIDISNYEKIREEGFYDKILININYLDIMGKEYSNVIPIYISISEPFQYYDYSKDTPIIEYEDLKCRIGDIKRDTK